MAAGKTSFCIRAEGAVKSMSKLHTAYNNLSIAIMMQCNVVLTSLPQEFQSKPLEQFAAAQVVTCTDIASQLHLAHL